MDQGTDSIADAREVAKRVASKHEAMLRQAAQEAWQLFPDPVSVSEEERLHGLGGILEKKLSEANIIDSSTPASKKNYMMSFLQKRLEALGPEQLKELGFGSGTTRVIRAGERLDLSILDKEGWIQAIR